MPPPKDVPVPTLPEIVLCEKVRRSPELSDSTNTPAPWPAWLPEIVVRRTFASPPAYLPRNLTPPPPTAVLPLIVVSAIVVAYLLDAAIPPPPALLSLPEIVE